MFVFISHSRVNSSAALSLCDQLRAQGVETWLDTRDLQPSVEWKQAVSSAIQGAGGFVFVIGPTSSGDRWQTFEWQQVVEHEYYLDSSKPLIPVLIGEPDLPGFLKSRQSLTLGDTAESCQHAAAKIGAVLKNPATSVDEKKLELGRQARQQALESFREYSQVLEKEGVKRAGIRAME